jgi:hypothetical protein
MARLKGQAQAECYEYAVAYDRIAVIGGFSLLDTKNLDLEGYFHGLSRDSG